jgi:hypothetical protein
MNTIDHPPSRWLTWTSSATAHLWRDWPDEVKSFGFTPELDPFWSDHMQGRLEIDARTYRF